jgi:hypothetical protein
MCVDGRLLTFQPFKDILSPLWLEGPHLFQAAAFLLQVRGLRCQPGPGAEEQSPRARELADDEAGKVGAEGVEHHGGL